MSRIFHRSPLRPPPLAVSGAGSFLYDAGGKRYYDGSSGAAVSCLGHGHPEVIAAIVKQLNAVEYAHTGYFSSEPAERLAALLARRSPASLGNAYFLSSGSEAVETALKMARQYHVDRGEPQRVHMIARQLSYHGNTLGALGIGGHVGRRALYQPLLADTHHVSPCFARWFAHPGESEADYGSRLAQELEQKILELGGDTVCAFVAETVVGATTGAVSAVPGYFKKIRAVCDKYGVLLILDEVMSGSGRTGSFHAFEQEGVLPDILTLAKGLGGGYQPIAAVLADDRVVNTIVEASGAFKNGHTYMGHPVACAAALAVQEIIEREDLVNRCARLGDELDELLKARFSEHPYVGDIRGRGLLRAVELVADRDRKLPFDPSMALHAKVKQEAMERGLICYPGAGCVDGIRGDHVLLAPPYITDHNELAAAVEILGEAIDAAVA